MAEVRELAVEAYGVCVTVSYAPEFDDAVATILPPGWAPGDPVAASARYTMLRNPDGGIDVGVDGESLVTTESVELALGVLDPQIRAAIALLSPELIFVHAGAIAVAGRGVVLPGRSFTGKTTLVAELVRAGAHYYSDEFAVLDAEGALHPYPKPLSMRLDATSASSSHELPAAVLGVTGSDPVPVAMIAIAPYRPGGRWSPVPQSPGVAALALLYNTIPARTRPDQALRALRAAADGAVAVETERGEAADAAAAILAMLV